MAKHKKIIDLYDTFVREYWAEFLDHCKDAGYDIDSQDTQTDIELMCAELKDEVEETDTPSTKIIHCPNCYGESKPTTVKISLDPTHPPKHVEGYECSTCQYEWPKNYSLAK